MLAQLVRVAMHEFGQDTPSAEYKALRSAGVDLYAEYHDSSVHDSPIPKHRMIHYPGRLQVNLGYEAGLKRWNRQWGTPQPAADAREEGFDKRAMELGVSTGIATGIELLNDHTGRKKTYGSPTIERLRDE
jgi:hypothetical protein